MVADAFGRRSATRRLRKTGRVSRDQDRTAGPASRVGCLPDIQYIIVDTVCLVVTGSILFGSTKFLFCRNLRVASGYWVTAWRLAFSGCDWTWGSTNLGRTPPTISHEYQSKGLTKFVSHNLLILKGMFFVDQNECTA